MGLMAVNREIEGLPQGSEDRPKEKGLSRLMKKFRWNNRLVFMRKAEYPDGRILDELLGRFV